MCENHAFVQIAKETPVNKIVNTYTMIAAKTEEISKNLWENYDLFEDVFLKNSDQKNHYDRLGTPADKLMYINNLIMKNYVDVMTRSSSPQQIKNCQDMMIKFMAAATKKLFWDNNTAQA